MIMKINEKSEFLIELAKFFLPFVIAGLGILVLYVFVDRATFGKLFLLMFAYFIPPLGKESVIPIGVSGGELTIPIVNQHIIVPAVNPLVMAFAIAFVDIMVALFLLWNYDLAKKIPFVGNFMIKVEGMGKNIEKKYGWIKPLRFIEVMLFVMVPFQGSGGLVGSIVGRLIGMKPLNTFIAISLGAIIGCLLISMFSQVFLIFARINVAITFTLVGIIIASILAYFIIKKLKGR